MSRHEIKWKGRRSGPYEYEELQRMFEAREIGPMHEVSVNGEWITARAFFRRVPSPSQPSPPVAAPPREDPPPSSIPTGSAVLSTPPPMRSTTPSPEAPTASPIPVPAGDPPPSDSPRSAEPCERYHAGFWIRAMALLLDGMVLLWTPLWLFDYFKGTSLLTLETARALSPLEWTVFSISAIGISWLYFTLLEGSPLQASLGKRFTGLTVSRANGEQVDFATSAIRNLAKIGSALILGAGFFLVLFTPRKQSFHDKVSRSVVLVHQPGNLAFSPEK